MFPALKTVGYSKCIKARNDWLPPWAHVDIYEIFYFVRGRVRWWVENKTYELSGNNIIIHPPGVLHGSPESVLHPSAYYWIQLHMPTLRRLNDHRWIDLLNGLGGLASLSFPGVPDLARSYQAILSEIQKPDGFSLIEIETSLMQIVAQVLRCHNHSGAPGRNSGGSKAIRLSVAWCQDHLAEATVDAMGQVARMPRENFRAAFVKEMGLTPLAFIHLKKIEVVKTRLMKGESVTEVAHSLGFSSSQHLATLFRKIEGYSPTDFLARA